MRAGSILLDPQTSSNLERLVLEGGVVGGVPDSHLNKLIGQAMTQKEVLITELEKELNIERERREQMMAQF